MQNRYTVMEEAGWEWGDVLMPCWIFSSIPGLYLLDAGSILSLVLTTQMVSRHWIVSWGDKIIPGWDPLPEGMVFVHIIKAGATTTCPHSSSWDGERGSERQAINVEVAKIS